MTEVNQVQLSVSMNGSGKDGFGWATSLQATLTLLLFQQNKNDKLRSPSITNNEKKCNQTSNPKKDPSLQSHPLTVQAFVINTKHYSS